MAALAVLSCDGCGELLAIGEADWVACPACGKRVVVPEPYRALRDADRDAATARARVETFYRKLARGPRVLTWLVRRAGKERGLSLYVGLAIAFALVLLASPIIILLAAWWLVALEPHVNVYQVLDPVVRGFAYGGGVYVALAVPALGFWALGSTRARRRHVLAAALAAGEPARAGGPAKCRACGAPLSVTPGACAAACLYCRAENLIVPRSQIIASEEHRSASLDDVLAEEEWQRRKVRRGLAAALLFPALAGLLMLIATWLVGAEYRWHEDGSLRCAGSKCAASRMVHLGRGQAVHVELDGTASGPPKLRLEGQSITPFPRSWETVAEATIDDHGRADLVAPWDGWFRVAIEAPGPADASFRTK